LLLHVAFNAIIAESNGKFDIKDVIESINRKLVKRHPHVFGTVKVSGKKDVLRNWEHIKMDEGRKSILDGVPKTLPALTRAYRLQEKSSKVGFDWETSEDAFKKVEEELREFKIAAENRKNKKGALSNADLEELEIELGDILFAIVNYARFLNINPENALRKTIGKYIKRFHYIEETLKERGKKITESSLEEMDGIWNEAKEMNL